MTEIERLVGVMQEKIHDPSIIRTTADGHMSCLDLPSIVRAILQAMRDRPSAKGLAAVEKTADEPVAKVRDEPMKSQIRAYIDHILSEAP